MSWADGLEVGAQRTSSKYKLYKYQNSGKELELERGISHELACLKARKR